MLPKKKLLLVVVALVFVMYPNRRESMEAVEKIVDGLKAQGYSFKTVSELLTTPD